MSIGSIGSVSFWQQDQNFWTQAQSSDQSTANSDAVISAMSSAMTSLSNGLASISNQEALTRTNNALTAAIQSELQQAQSGGSTSSSSTNSTGSSSSGSSSSSSSSGSSTTAGSLATGTGTVPLTASTPLSTLRIPPNSAITVSDGNNTTTYTTTGTDTVTDLIGAINTNVYGNAQVTASLNSNGSLVLTGEYDSDNITVGGTFASAIGFGTGNNQFSPTPPSAPSSSATDAASVGTGSSSSASAASSSGIPQNSAIALQTGGTAELLLASNGAAGTLLNVLA